MAPSKLLAEWFWVDRWTGSSAFQLPLEARGLYREMLSQAWRRDARLPNDHEAIQRLVGATLKEWRRCWPAIERYWRIDGDSLVNDTQLEIYQRAKHLETVRSEAGMAGNRKRWGDRKPIAKDIANGIAKPVANEVANTIAKASPLSLSPENASHSPSPLPPSSQINGRSKRPVFVGTRLKVFDWQLEDLMEMLGKHADSFGFDLWFQTLDRRVVASGEVLPGRDGGAWLKAETLAEARRRGLPIAGEKGGQFDDDYGPDFPAAWSCRTCGQMHEGTRAQSGTCLKPRVATR
jgi:uncharacterized protein YdaU (DUF1376 family)